MTSAYKITAPVLEAMPELPKPDWSLLQRHNSRQSRDQLLHMNDELTTSLSQSHNIIQSAQLIIQHTQLTKLNQSLQAKESKKKNDCTKLLLFPGGFGRHLTAPEVRDLLQQQEQRKEAEVAKKAKRKEAKEAQKGAKATAQLEWEKIKTNHQSGVERWEIECEA